MQLSIENIGYINSADIEIRGLTLIAGPNNTGKSTIGKVLYTVFNGLYNIDCQIEDEMKNTIISYLLNRRLAYSSEFYREVRKEEFTTNLIHVEEDKIEKILDDLFSKLEYNNEFYNENKQEYIKNIKITRNIPKYEYKKELLNRRFSDEFDGQINNISVKKGYLGRVSLQIKDRNICLTVDNNLIMGISSDTDIFSRAVYVDEPYIMDDIMVNRYSYKDHRNEMKMMLQNSFRKDVGNNLVLKERLSKVISILSKACNGRIVKKNNRLYYSDTKMDGDVAVRNMSTGLKSVSILRELLEREIIQSKGVLILDEPEIHLHPQWQLIFAETLVLLQKEFELHILLNTHSPYFINAIEIFSKKHNIDDVCKYYLAQGTDSDIMFKDVTDDRSDIYDLLAHPFQTLENEEYGE